MNKQDLGAALRDTPETKVKVSEGLNQDIMRAIRLSAPVAKTPLFNWRVPAWGAALAVTGLAVFQFSQPVETESPLLVESLQAPVPVSLLAMGDQLFALSEDVLLPEKELKLELERLKSDLQRLGLST
jgi:hypothetical protein